MNPVLSALLSRHLIDRQGQHRRKVLAAFQQSCDVDFLDASVRRAKRNELLSRLLNQARQHVPYFSRIMSRSPEIAAHNAQSILSTLPILKRSQIQHDMKQFVAENAAEMFDDATGGSSGTPMVFKVDRDTQIAREASLMWANSLAGWRPGDRIAMLWGSDRDVSTSLKNLRLTLRWQIENYRWFNAFDMGAEKMARFHDTMRRFRPHLIVAYAGSVFTFARYLRDSGIKPGYPSSAIVSSAEVLAPEMRELVEDVFGIRVFDRYGNREAGAIAAECSTHSGLHVNESDFIVEIDSSDPFRVPGNVLITYLRNFAMPLIRYDTGDSARFGSCEPCSCSRATPRLAPVTGRESDNIRTASGAIIHGEFFTHLLYGTGCVREFQFVQESLMSYRLLLAGSRRMPGEMKEDLRRRILDAVGRDCALAIEMVEKIPALPSGKRKFTLSRLR